MKRKLSKEQQRIQEELCSQGWSLVDTTKYLTGLGNLKGKWLKKDAYLKITRNHSATNDPLSLANYKKFIKRTIKNCLYDENLIFDDLHLRHHKKEKQYKCGVWHLDGGAIRVIGTIKGESTEFKVSKESRKVLQIPEGWSLIFTGKERHKIKPTLHRMPAHAGSRKLVVSTFRGQGALMIKDTSY